MLFRSIFSDNLNWQAQIKSLELYGKAKGWLREQTDFDKFAGFMGKIADMMKAYGKENLKKSDQIFGLETEQLESKALPSGTEVRRVSNDGNSGVLVSFPAAPVENISSSDPGFVTLTNSDPRQFPEATTHITVTLPSPLVIKHDETKS